MTAPDRAEVAVRATARAASVLPNPRLARRQRNAGVAAVTAAIVLGLIALVLWFQAGRPLDGTVNTLTYVSTLAALVGTSLMLFLLLLITRWPVLERAFGQDHLVTWHKILGPWAVWLIGIHVLLIITAYAVRTDQSWFKGLFIVIRQNQGIGPALVGLATMVALGLTSWSRTRRTIRHETWWTIHLLTYLGVTLAFFHQVVAGRTFGTGPARVFWVALYLLVLGLVVWNRVLVPIFRSRRHRLVVTDVVRESDEVVSVWMSGRNLDRLGLLPGQFLNFRFKHQGISYEAHPYSVSGANGDQLRITVKALGDGSAALADVPVGTRVTFAGPYGVMTPVPAAGSRYVLIAGGVGVGPILSLANSFAGSGVPMDVVYRASVPEHLVLADELRALESAGHLRLHLLPGSRTVHTLEPDYLTALLGDISGASVFVCGPESMIQRVSASAQALGVPASRVHSEIFDL